MALASFLVAIIGIVFTFQQTGLATNSTRDSREQILKTEILQEVNEAKTAIESVAHRLLNLEIEFSSHRSAMSHEGAIREIMLIKDKVSEINAAQLLLTKDAEISFRLSKIESQIKQITSAEDLEIEQ